AIIVMMVAVIVVPPVVIAAIVMVAVAIPLAAAPVVPTVIVIVIPIGISEGDISEIERDPDSRLGRRWNKGRCGENRSTSRKHRRKDCFSHNHISIREKPAPPATVARQ